jgi:hypothetical protein
MWVKKASKIKTISLMNSQMNASIIQAAVQVEK